MDFFKKHTSASDVPKRDGDFYKKRVLDEVDAGKVPIIGSNSFLVMKPILRLRFVDPTSKEVGISVLIFTTGDVLGPEDIPLTTSSQTDKILPTKLLVYDGCASWVYEMRMYQQAKDIEVTYSVGSIQRKFFLCGYESFNAAFFSCNGRKRVLDEIAMEEAGGIAERWLDVYQETTKRQTSLLIGMGDQLYMDFFQSMDEMIKFWALPIDKQAVEPFPPETEEKLRKLYFWKYLFTFSRPNFNDTMGNTLTMFVWDDHEIFDGYGSYPPAQQISPTFQGAFKIAKWAYRLFQHHFTSYYINSNLVNQKSKLYFGKSLHTVYHLGQVTILNLDARSERSKLQVVSSPSYIEMQKQIQQIPQTCHHLITVCTIPLIFPQLTNAVNALEQVAAIFPKLYAKIPGDPLDDFMDQWRSHHHLTERKFLIELLQEAAKKRGVRCSIFSGDVHVGCVGKILPEKPLPTEQEDYRVIYNMTTSGISSKYSPAMRNVIYNLCIYNNKNGDHIGANTTMHSLGVMVPFESSSHVESDHPERDRMVVARNNWAAVTLDNKNLVFELRALPTVEQHKDSIPDLIKYKTTIPNLEWKRSTSERVFRIEVVTSDMNIAVAKPDSISIVLSDEQKNKSEDIFLSKLESYNSTIFRSGQKDIFKYTSSKLFGEISKCTIKKSSTFTQYHLNRIDIIDEQSHEIYTFVFNQWIEKESESKYNTKRSITVFTLEAKHLRLSGFGYPTTKVSYGGQPVFKTSGQPSINPCWTMAYSSFTPKAIQENVLEVAVVEEDLVKKERLAFGVVKIDLSKYPKGQVIDDWFEITDAVAFSEDNIPAKTEEKKETVTKKLKDSVEKKLSQKKEEKPKMEIYSKYTQEQPLTSTTDPILINIWNDLVTMGIKENDRHDIINYIKKKQTKPTIHLRIHYFSKFPEIGTNQRLFFDEDIYANIKTGDVIAYCGIHLISKLIQGKTGVAVSHLGIALRIRPRDWGEKKRLPDIGEEIHDPDQEMIFVVEATSNLYKKPDYFDDKIRKGVNIFALHDRLRTTDMRSAWHYPLTTPLDNDQQKKLIGFLKEQYDKGVQYDMKQMLLNGFVHDQEEDLTTLFCSELVAAAMKNVGVVQCNPSVMSPGDVVGLNIYQHDTPKILAYV